MLVYQFAVKFVGLGYMYACKSMLLKFRLAVITNNTKYKYRK